MAHLYPGIFFIGPTAERVSFASQQRRSLNLTWALNETVGLAGKRVAVVGGGLAGLTAAAGAVACGADVYLFEAQDELCPHQRETDHRFIHPSINFWPSEPLSGVTNWPFLNWYAAPSRDVISEVERQWKRDFSDRTAVEKNARVHSVENVNDKVRLTYGDAGSSKDFNLVILAAGFGQERSLPSVAADSYWQDRAIDRLTITKTRRIWISGTGDGALIDCLRVCYRAFQRGQILVQTAMELDAALRVQIIEVEVKAASLPSDEERSEFLAREYQDLADRPTVFKPLSKALAKGDVKPFVNLVHRLPTPFDGRTAPIHRLLFAVALKEGLIEPIRGDLSSNASGPILIRHGSGKAEAINADRIILRHGAEGALNGLISKGAIAELQSESYRKHQNALNSAQWPDRYFESLMTSRFTRMNDQLSEFLKDAVRIFRGAMSAHNIQGNVSLIKPNGIYTIDAKIAQHDSTRIRLLPDSVLGVPVNMSIESEVAVLHGRSTSAPLVVRPGSLIGFGSDAPDQWHPITCLSGGPAPGQAKAVCLLHAQSIVPGTPVYLHRADSAQRIGHVGRLILHRTSDKPGSEPAAVFVLVDLDTHVAARGAPSGKVLTGFIADPIDLLSAGAERNVQKWGSGSTPSAGVVSSVAGSMLLPGPRGAGTLLTDVITVESETTFSVPGDSGSMVVTATGGMAVGAIIAGSTLHTFLIPIGQILDLCQIQLMTSEAVGDIYDASLLLELGRLRNDRWQLDEAAAFFERAVAVSARGSLEALYAAVDLSLVRSRQGRFSEAESILRARLDERAQTPDSRPLLDALVLQRLGNACADQRRFDEGEGYVRRALEIRMTVQAEDHRDVSNTLRSLASVLRRQGRLDEAHQLIEKVLTIRQRTIGLHHVDTADAIMELGWLFLDKGQLSDAFEQFEKARLILERLEISGPQLAATLHALGAALARQGRPEHAEKVLREALEIRRAVLGEHHPVVGASLLALGNVLSDIDRMADGETALIEGLLISKAVFGEDHLETARLERALGSNLRRQRKFDEAEHHLQRAFAIRTTAPVIAAELHEVCLEIGWLRLELGRLDLAEQAFRQVLEGSRDTSSGATSSPLLAQASAMQGLASVLSRQADSAEAEAMFREALAIRESVLGGTHLAIVNSIMGLANILGERGQLAEAENLYRRAIVIREDRLGPHHRETVAALKSLGSVLRRQQKFDEAEQVLMRAAQIAAKSPQAHGQVHVQRD